jgi:hypothetical protein
MWEINLFSSSVEGFTWETQDRDLRYCKEAVGLSRLKILNVHKLVLPVK